MVHKIPTKQSITALDFNPHGKTDPPLPFDHEPTAKISGSISNRALEEFGLKRSEFQMFHHGKNFMAANKQNLGKYTQENVMEKYEKNHKHMKLKMDLTQNKKKMMLASYQDRVISYHNRWNVFRERRN